MDVKLIAESGPAKGQAVVVRTPKFFIGSHPNCQLRPAIPGLVGIHALIEQRGVGIHVRDFGAEGGTMINGRLLSAKEYEASNGDLLEIGPLALRFVVAQKAIDEPPALTQAPEGWPLSIEQPAEEAASESDEESDTESPIPWAPHSAIETALRYDTVGDVLVVTLTTAELTDEATVSPLRNDLKGLLELPLPRKVVIDLSQVSYLSSRAVGVVLAFYQGLSKLGGTMRVCCVHPQVAPVLGQMRLSMLVDIIPTYREAVEQPWE